MVPIDLLDDVLARLEDVKRAEAELDARVAAGLTMTEFASAVIEGDRVKWLD